MTSRLARLVPRLEHRFRSQANAQGQLVILSEKQSQSAWSQFPDLSPRKEASVLIPLVQLGEEIHVVFTKRSSHMRSHSSEISFPGGGKEEQDSSLVDTALRETREELQNDLDWTIIGQGTVVPSIRGRPVTPVLAAYTTPLVNDLATTFPGDSDEVESVFSVSIEELIRVETSRPLARLGTPAPVYDIDNLDDTIWGLTAFVLRPILHKVLKPVLLESKL